MRIRIHENQLNKIFGILNEQGEVEDVGNDVETGEDNVDTDAPILYGGWVNVKIDKDIQDRVRKLINAMGFVKTGDLNRKFAFLSNPHKWKSKGGPLGVSIQERIGALLLTQHLKEVKERFDPSSSGFLFENFMAGLIPADLGAARAAVDLKGHNGEDYQLKFYQGGKRAYIPWGSSVGEVDKYLIALKYPGEIKIWQFNPNHLYETNPQSGIYIPRVESDTNNLIGILNFNEIDSGFNKIAGNIMSEVNDIWETISKLQFNIESITTGVTKEGEKIDVESAYNQAKSNTQKLDQQIDAVTGRMGGN